MEKVKMRGDCLMRRAICLDKVEPPKANKKIFGFRLCAIILRNFKSAASSLGHITSI